MLVLMSSYFIMLNTKWSQTHSLVKKIIFKRHWYSDNHTIKLILNNLNCFFIYFFSQDMDEMSSNSCSGSTVSTLQYRSIPQIHFPPPPMQSSSAYECYANVIVPKRRMPFENGAPGSLNEYHNETMHESLPIEQLQPEHYYDQYADQYGRRQSVSLPCYECIEMQNMPVYYASSKVQDDYDIYSQRRHLDRFGLSKKGLLQIDYSLSWMNLQRLISSKWFTILFVSLYFNFISSY